MSFSAVSRWAATLRAMIAAPTLRAVKRETCTYSIPTSARSALESTGRLIAPGTWSSANSAGLRTSMTASNGARLAGSAALTTSISDMNGARALCYTPPRP